jgi:hypothetical protein
MGDFVTDHDHHGSQKPERIVFVTVLGAICGQHLRQTELEGLITSSLACVYKRGEGFVAP